MQVQQEIANHPRALRASRQAFPFLEILARWSWFCRTPPTPPITPTATSTPFSPSCARGGGRGGGGAESVDGQRELAGDGGEGGDGDGGGGGGGGGAGGLSRGGRVRGRGDTGVASLLVALAKADPSGETIRSMQRWVCGALLPEQVGAVCCLW